MNENIEDLLRQDPPEPGADLRARVLSAVRAELRSAPRQPSAPRASLSPGWRSLATLAALVILWMHVAWSAALQERLEWPSDSPAEFTHSTAQLHDLLPELSDVETKNMALRLCLGAAATRRGGATRCLER